MDRDLRVSALALLTAFVLPAAAAAQAPPTSEAPVAPKVERLDPTACAEHDTRSTQGRGWESGERQAADTNLSDKLVRSDGVICPPPHADTEIEAPTPPAGRTPVIRPPDAGGDSRARPK
jgi:hypothetical protein